jgi:acetyltransferase-like isoleucine patch superfamily enzyme
MSWRRRKEMVSSVVRSYLPGDDERRQVRPPVARGVEIGRHTYGYGESTFTIYAEGARIVVGSFCSIHAEARVLGGGEHVRTRASTFPLNALLFDRAKRMAPDAVDTGPTVIGNDVFIGVGAIVLGGVTVGDGAVIGAGAVVNKPVPPYAVVVGNPARVARYRFENEIRERLLALRWWDWSDDQIRAMKKWFMSDIESFLAEAERVHGTTSRSPPASDR